MTPDFASAAMVERRVIDSKAMRKVHLSDVQVAVFETTEVGAGSTMFASYLSRVLTKLP